MKIEHVAIWTRQLEELKNYYTKYFEGIAGEIYINSAKSFQSYFITFDSGTRLEIMSNPDIPENQNDTVELQHIGLTHLAFEVESMTEVDLKAEELRSNGYPILNGPRKTGDGYYEFVSLDPDQNRIEVTTAYAEKE